MGSGFKVAVRPQSLKGIHSGDLVKEEDLQKVFCLLKGRRDIEAVFTLTHTTIEKRTRCRYAGLLALIKDYLPVQGRNCPSGMAADGWP